jgi:hypothetical protein
VPDPGFQSQSGGILRTVHAEVDVGQAQKAVRVERKIIHQRPQGIVLRIHGPDNFLEFCHHLTPLFCQLFEARAPALNIPGLPLSTRRQHADFRDVGPQLIMKIVSDSRPFLIHKPLLFKLPTCLDLDVQCDGPLGHSATEMGNPQPGPSQTNSQRPQRRPELPGRPGCRGHVCPGLSDAYFIDFHIETTIEDESGSAVPTIRAGSGQDPVPGILVGAQGRGIHPECHLIVGGSLSPLILGNDQVGRGAFHGQIGARS